MVIRKLKERQFAAFHKALMMKAHAEPLSASYTAKIIINGAEYVLKVQPIGPNKIAVLQALRVYREKYGPDFERITERTLLSALLELLIYQGVAS